MLYCKCYAAQSESVCDFRLFAKTIISAYTEGHGMKIEKANFGDLQKILDLQYLAYQSEAELLGDYDIPPLKQKLTDIEKEFSRGIILKAVDENGDIIGSVRAYEEFSTIYIGKLIVHPSHRKKGIGTALLLEAEKAFAAERCELFTSDKSADNIRLYEKCGYKKFTEKEASPSLRFVFLQKNMQSSSACDAI